MPSTDEKDVSNNMNEKATTWCLTKSMWGINTATVSRLVARTRWNYSMVLLRKYALCQQNSLLICACVFWYCIRAMIRMKLVNCQIKLKRRPMYMHRQAASDIWFLKKNRTSQHIAWWRDSTILMCIYTSTRRLISSYIISCSAASWQHWRFKVLSARIKLFLHQRQMLVKDGQRLDKSQVNRWSSQGIPCGLAWFLSLFKGRETGWLGDVLLCRRYKGNKSSDEVDKCPKAARRPSRDSNSYMLVDANNVHFKKNLQL